MRILQIQNPIFKAMPKNYVQIDNYISRSAQPDKEDFLWLKEQGVTDVINFRTLVVEKIDFNEEQEVKKVGLTYHSIPSVTRHPKEENILRFLDIIEKVKAQAGKVHIHCMAGADRTGMYAFIYKVLNKIGTIADNEKEWLERGHNIRLYPNLRNWTKDFMKTIK